MDQNFSAFVPDAQARLDAAPIVKTMGLLNLWPVAPAGAPDFTVTADGDGVAQVQSSPLRTIREGFGTARLQRPFSRGASLVAVCTTRLEHSATASPFHPGTP